MTASGTPNVATVRGLLAQQYPALRTMDVRPSATSGSSNWMFRVGEKHAVRLPRSDDAADELLKEARWLSGLAPALPVPIPEVLFLGSPSAEFGRPWTVVTWVPGELPGDLDPADQQNLATSLGRFVRALHAVDTGGLSAGAEQWGYRAGHPVTETIDEWLDQAADGLGDIFDPQRVREAWLRLRDVPASTAGPCWIHADLSPENLLVRPDGTLSGVIDFGALSIGGPSIDLLYGWGMFDGEAREMFRRESGVDRATWLRSRAWAFVGPGLVTIADYRDSMPERTARLVHMVETVARDVEVDLHP